MSQIELTFRAPSRRNDRKDGGDDDERGGPKQGPPVFSVTDLVRGANRMLEGRFSNLWVEGEVSNLKLGGAGHAFFTLRDESAALPVAMWRSSVERLRFRLADGQLIRVFGRLGIFAKQGRFQMYADRAQPAGLGALMVEFEERKARLAAEGFFAPERKRPLPSWPRRIGVVTSPHGAAIHDILEVARRRCRSCILLSPSVVQGPDAPRSLIVALQRVVAQPDIDVVIIGRGGGSMEDLWCFNDEALARAVAACPVPIVSAVGHEVDVTLCDLVADVRAATPSQAAEIVVPDFRATQQALGSLARRLERSMERHSLDHRVRLDQARNRLATLGRGLARGPRRSLQGLVEELGRQHPRERIDRDRKRLTALVRRLHACGGSMTKRDRARLDRLRAAVLRRGGAIPRTARTRFERAHATLVASGAALPRLARLRLVRAAGALHALSPLAVLERGYAVVTDDQARVVTRARTVDPGDRLRVRLREGALALTVDERHDDPEEAS